MNQTISNHKPYIYMGFECSFEVSRLFLLSDIILLQQEGVGYMNDPIELILEAIYSVLSNK